jgi:hypothetical protein
MGFWHGRGQLLSRDLPTTSGECRAGFVPAILGRWEPIPPYDAIPTLSGDFRCRTPPMKNNPPRSPVRAPNAPPPPHTRSTITTSLPFQTSPFKLPPPLFRQKGTAAPSDPPPLHPSNSPQTRMQSPISLQSPVSSLLRILPCTLKFSCGPSDKLTRTDSEKTRASVRIGGPRWLVYPKPVV